MSRFMHSRHQTLSAYVPGEQPTDMAYIKLNTNESPYPPSKAVRSAITNKEVKRLKLYPDPTCCALKSALAKAFSVRDDQIFVSNGSDDILNFAFMAFAEKGATFPNITYGFYEVFSQLHGVAYETIPLNEDFTITPKDYYQKAGIVVIANPNAPTGLLLTVSEIEEIVKQNPDSVVLIDEAYIDFGGTSCAPLVQKYDNLLVVQTFSKSKSLAGGRIGFAVGNAELIADLEKIKYSTNPYSINRLSLLAATAAVQSPAYYKKTCAKIVAAREYTKQALKERGFIVTDSYANFLFVKKEGLGGAELYEKLRKKGILVRHFSKDAISDYNRITIGTKKQMKALLCALDAIDKEANQ